MGMDWVGDFLAFCLAHGFGGLALLAIAGFLVASVLLGVAAAGKALGAAFVRGWRSAG
jgi:hypothetical protein